MIMAVSTTDMSVEFVSQNDPRWLDFVERARPSLFQTPRWCNLIAQEYGFKACVALALEGATAVGGLPYAEVEDFRGRRRVAYAFSDVCEPLGDVAAWTVLESALCADGIPWQIRSRVAPSAVADCVEQPGVHQTIALPGTVAEAATKFHQKQRVNALRLERSGAICRRVSDASFVEPFYALFSTLRKRKFRLLPQSLGFFERVAAAYFPDRGFGLLAEVDGRAVAAMMLLSQDNTLYVKYSASDMDAQAMRPTNYIFGRAIEEAVGDGYRHLDLGISVESGLQRFKRHLGAESVPYFTARYGQQTKSPAILQMEDALTRVTYTLTEPDVPLSAAVNAGDVLYRFFV